MKKIPLSQGKYALIDDEDFNIVSLHNWYYNKLLRKNGVRKTGYAVTTVHENKILMHRLILGLCKDEICDHLNGNGLDNTRKNLRIATKYQNQQNIGKKSHNTSGYKGVWFQKSRLKNEQIKKNRKMWVAEIRANGKRYFLGLFLTAKEASVAYNKAAKKLHGDFVNTN